MNNWRYPASPAAKALGIEVFKADPLTSEQQARLSETGAVVQKTFPPGTY